MQFLTTMKNGSLIESSLAFYILGHKKRKKGQKQNKTKTEKTAKHQMLARKKNTDLSIISF